VVLIILGILASVAVARYNGLEENSKQIAIDSAISDLNGRETLTWANQKLSTTGYDNDQNIVNAIDYNLGDGYTWSIAPSQTGGTLEFQGLSAPLTRTESDISKPAVWSL
jgi:hypothetical protein